MIIELKRRWPFLSARRASLVKLEARLAGHVAAFDSRPARDPRPPARRPAAVQVPDEGSDVAASKRARHDELEGLLREHANHTAETKERLRRTRQRLLEAKSANAALWSHWVARAAARRAQGEQLPPPPFAVVAGEVDGLHLTIPASDSGDSTLERRVRDRGRFVRSEIELRRLFSRGSGPMIDIGANVGLTCLPHAVLPDFPRILALEPETRNFACLQRNVAVNGLGAVIECHRTAIGDAPGHVELAITAKSGTHFVGEWSPDAVADAAGPQSARERVPVATLDAFLAGHLAVGCIPSLIKCDTQGAEGRILAGATGLLARRESVWQIEFWPAGLERCGSDVNDVCARIAAAFSSFVDLDQPMVEIRSVAHLGELASTLRPKQFTDLILLP